MAQILDFKPSRNQNPLEGCGHGYFKETSLSVDSSKESRTKSEISELAMRLNPRRELQGANPLSPLREH